MISRFAVVILFIAASVVRAEEYKAPGNLYYEFAMKKSPDGLGYASKEALDWTFTIPKNVMFRFDEFQKRVQAFRTSSPQSAMTLEVVQKIFKEVEAIPLAPTARPRTIEEAKRRQFELLSSSLSDTRRSEELSKMMEVRDAKESSGIGMGPYGGIGRYYYYEQKMFPKDPDSKARWGVGVYVEDFPFYSPYRAYRYSRYGYPF